MAVDPDARGPNGTGRQHRELVAAMSFCHPRRFIAQPLGEFYAVDDLAGGGAAGERNTDSWRANLQSYAFTMNQATNPNGT
jgi:hypothetical protein